MNERDLDGSALELAALYALSALAPAEMEEVARVWRDRPDFWAEVRSLRDAAAGLAESGPRKKPRRDLWPEVRARLRARATEPAAGARPDERAGTQQVWKHWRGGSSPESWVLSAQEGDFEATDVEGITARRLSVDEEADRVTMLVRMTPGSAYPAHRHGGSEECYVLAGDLSVGDGTTLRPGDYQRMAAGSEHPVQATSAGCLLLITCSRHDELLD